jgi:PTH1 family peptidyl-tRNA hydrolase
MTNIQLVVGLGNPGAQYALTRHNVGQWLVIQCAADARLSFQLDTKLQAQVTRWQTEHFDCRLALPTTYMNLSGSAVQKLSHYFKIPVESILVVHDDLDLEPGTARLKIGGGHGGHNGLRDIIEHMGNGFSRCRLGIGHPGSAADVSNFVLVPPKKTELVEIEHAISDSLRVIPSVLKGEMSLAMNVLHT